MIALKILTVVVLVLLFSAVIGSAVGTVLDGFHADDEPFVQGSNVRPIYGERRPYDYERDEVA